MSINKDKMKEMQEQVLVMKQNLEEEENKSLAPAETQDILETEETANKNTEATAQMVMDAQQMLEAVEVNRVAEGQPVQPQQAPQFSSKKWKRDRQKAAIAKQHCEIGTATTYDLVQQLQEQAAKQNAISDAYAAQCEAAHVEGRFLRGFCRGYKRNEQGQPATEQDAVNRQLDDAFVADYCSNHLERRVPHLERMVQDVLSIKLTADILSEKSLRARAAELSRWADMSTYMENVMNDPINQPYFERIDEAKKMELTERLDTLAKFSTAFSGKVAQHGVILDGRYREGMTKEMQEDMRRNAAPVEEEYKESERRFLRQEREREAQKKNFGRQEIFRKYERELRSVRTLSKEQIEQAAGDYSKKMWLRGRTLARLKEDPSLGLTQAEKDGVYFSRAVMLLKDGVEHEAENLQMLRLLKELQPLGADHKPSIELYLRAKEALAPKINKVLDLDIEAWKQMSDAELVSRMDELNELFMDGMFVADLLKLKHPHMTSKEIGDLTLKNELIGQRQAEYSYKSSVLRALAERARSFAILAKAQTNGRFELSDFTQKEQGMVRNGAEEFLNGRIDNISKGLMQSAETKYENTFIPGTKEFKSLTNELQEVNPSKLIMDDLRFYPVIEELITTEDPELKKVMQRLNKDKYYSLKYSEAEMKAMGLKKNIGEQIFRSFDSFLSMEATRTLLTPETFRQMLLDLGAGAGMHKGEWEETQQVEEVNEAGEKINKMQQVTMPGTPQPELEEAVRKNDRGLQTYKRVISAQIDMLARKYGEGLEHLTIRDVIERHVELAADFDDAQVMMGMISYHPDMCDMKEPMKEYLEAEHSAEDKLLMARVIYFSIAGKAINDVISFLSAKIITSDEGVEEHVKTLVSGLGVEDCIIARKYLEENDPTFFHKVDWNQKVTAPAAEE